MHHWYLLLVLFIICVGITSVEAVCIDNCLNKLTSNVTQMENLSQKKEVCNIEILSVELYDEDTGERLDTIHVGDKFRISAKIKNSGSSTVCYKPDYQIVEWYPNDSLEFHPLFCGVPPQELHPGEEAYVTTCGWFEALKPETVTLRVRVDACIGQGEVCGCTGGEFPPLPTINILTINITQTEEPASYVKFRGTVVDDFSGYCREDYAIIRVEEVLKGGLQVGSLIKVYDMTPCVYCENGSAAVDMINVGDYVEVYGDLAGDEIYLECRPEYLIKAG